VLLTIRFKMGRTATEFINDPGRKEHGGGGRKRPRKQVPARDLTSWGGATSTVGRLKGDVGNKQKAEVYASNH